MGTSMYAHTNPNTQDLFGIYSLLKLFYFFIYCPNSYNFYNIIISGMGNSPSFHPSPIVLLFKILMAFSYIYSIR